MEKTAFTSSFCEILDIVVQLVDKGILLYSDPLEALARLGRWAKKGFWVSTNPFDAFDDVDATCRYM